MAFYHKASQLMRQKRPIRRRCRKVEFASPPQKRPAGHKLLHLKSIRFIGECTRRNQENTPRILLRVLNFLLQINLEIGKTSVLDL